MGETRRVVGRERTQRSQRRGEEQLGERKRERQVIGERLGEQGQSEGREEVGGCAGQRW